ncbi:MAG: protein kinase [Synechococcaceae cyanobacterium RL_1_2]|nr:protein kinase [Synechococcaceae cyanobacterium RL_1_2]
MSYCLNPDCPQPKNPPKTVVCKACGTKLLLKDRYLPVKTLGQGGFGATFLVVDISLPGNPLSVVKQLRPASSVPHVFEMARELFEREAQTLGRIGNHPQVPRLLDYFENSQQFYLVQEFVKGSNLQQEVKKNGPFSEAGIKQFLQEIMPLLEYIHEQQVIHRDIKPANLIRREQDKKLVLIDFGAVKNRVNLEEAENTSDQTALTAFAVGTPGFAPPEQMAMRPVYASDIYAVGVTCIYLLTGKSPKDLSYSAATGEMMWKENIDVSEHLITVLEKMLEVSVRHRYQSAQEVLDALDMAPYLDSLAEGLATPIKKDKSISPSGGLAGATDRPLTGGDNKGASASSRLAMAIRARRQQRAKGGAKDTMGTSFGQTSFGTSPTAASKLDTNQQKRNKVKSSKGSGRMTAKELLDAFKSGRKGFNEMNLSNLVLTQAELSGAIFHQAKMVKINLQGANLSHADFGKANLKDANLKDANLGRAYLSYCNLEKADLRGADLRYAHFSYANLTGTNLCGANLTNAKISEDQLNQAKTNWMTIMPNGKRGFLS